jgi:pyruvate formate lyase activating enzyme
MKINLSLKYYYDYNFRNRQIDQFTMIFNIQRFSTHDGEGIRTMIFYKGCPLHCEWCSNPESQSFEPSLMFDSRLCKSFLECTRTGSKAVSLSENRIIINRALAGENMKFRDVCPTRALTVSGEEKNVSEIITEIEKDLPFYRTSSGGVTLSGGEPLSQGPELVELLAGLKSRNIDSAIETSLHVSWEKVERCINLTGTFLVDLKHTNIDKFKKQTGGDASLVMMNLIRLSARHNNIIIRVPVIPGFNHTYDEIKEIIDFTVSLKSVREINFLPFHTLGSEKYKMLGMENSFTGVKKVSTDELHGYIKYSELMGLIVKTGG